MIFDMRFSNVLSSLLSLQSAFHAPKASCKDNDRLLFSTTWDLLGPFQIGTRGTKYYLVFGMTVSG